MKRLIGDLVTIALIMAVFGLILVGVSLVLWLAYSALWSLTH